EHAVAVHVLAAERVPELVERRALALGLAAAHVDFDAVSLVARPARRLRAIGAYDARHDEDGHARVARLDGAARRGAPALGCRLDVGAQRLIGAERHGAARRIDRSLWRRFFRGRGGNPSRAR